MELQDSKKSAPSDVTGGDITSDAEEAPCPMMFVSFSQLFIRYVRRRKQT
jgi:hypothetical protein